MAEKTTPPFVLNAKNVAGLIQRELMELNMYLSQPAQNINGQVVKGFLGEAFRFAELLPAQPVAKEPTNEASRARN